MPGLISSLAAGATAASYTPFPGPFPHNRNVTTDVTIATPTTWTEADYPGRIVCLDRLDVDDVLTLRGGPWFIFVDTCDGGVSGAINGDGPSGAASGTFNADYARGALATDAAPARAQGGCGGVMIFMCVREFTGEDIPISANGGAGYRDTGNAGALKARGGQGAFSPTADNASAAEEWDGTLVNTDTFKAYLHPFAQLLGMGGGASVTGFRGRGGGSGFGNDAGSQNSGGGSGIGGGGANVAAGALPVVSEPSVGALLDLALAGCLGGGGGSAALHSTGANNAAGGGGGGCVVVWAKTLTATPTLSANGGAAAAAGGAGAAGVTYLIDIP